ncbi:uroporphyrinogen-III C-methyltransferase [Corallincola platygyrae]|uniref:uroporphyrinogen-III C-methyltransferase n=1 Tax=Corallincola platygyrae TaxID=1193278 RepID=A0ABW4XN15_9GAMM
MTKETIIKFEAATGSQKPVGKVWLVGSGPGDADLLTVKALRTIQTADLILYDALVSDEIRDLFPKQTAALFVGKSKNHHSIPQNALNQLLKDKALEGFNICRLKGGDPFVFGRGGEEALELRQVGVEVEIVPGITAASGCTSYAGIPLTHRGMSQACTFITAHGESGLNLDWQNLAESQHTLVVYMGLSKLAFIRDRLTGAGLTASTPAALISNGCRDNQKTVIGTLSELPEMAATHQLPSPTLVVIGEVVTLAPALNWFNELIESEQHQLSA